MTVDASVAIAGLGLWMPGYPSLAARAAGRFDAQRPAPTGLALARSIRRRAGVLGRALADSAAEAMQAAGVDPSQTPIVVGSSLGEASTMIGLLEQMWRLKTPMSPAAFTVSVHNAASGLLSISNKNHGYVTSLAADEDTPAAALLEGIGLVHDRQQPVLIVCSEEPAPVCLVEDSQTWDLLSAAVVLAPLDPAWPCLARLHIVQGPAATLAPSEVDERLAHNPQVGLLDLVQAVLARVSGTVALDRGTGRGYVARLEFERAP